MVQVEAAAGGDGEASRALLWSRLLLLAAVATVCVWATITNIYNSNNTNNDDDDAGHHNYEAVKLRVERRPCQLYPGQEQRLPPPPMGEDKALAMMRRAATSVQTHLYSPSSSSSDSPPSPSSYPRKPVPRVTLCFVHAPMSIPSLAVRHHILVSAPRVSHLLRLRDAAIKPARFPRQPTHDILDYPHATLATIKPHVQDLDNTTESHILALIYTSMAHVWLWDGNGAAPSWLLTGMADYLTVAAGLNSLNDSSTDIIPNLTTDIGYDISCYHGQRAYWAGGFLQYCETLMPGFVPALNAKLSTGWNQSFFHDLLGRSFEDLWLTYTNSTSPINKHSADNLHLSQIR